LLGRDLSEDGGVAERGEVIIEFRHNGAYVKVSAIDVNSGTEVSIVGDPAAGEAALRRLALRKLDYVIAKNLAKNQGS
jgi:hypothetical protein